MFLYPLPALVNAFPRIFIIKGNVNNSRNPPYCPFSALMTSFLNMEFINEEITGFINEEATEAPIGAITVPINSLSCFLFNVLLFQKHHQKISLNFPATL